MKTRFSVCFARTSIGLGLLSGPAFPLLAHAAGKAAATGAHPASGPGLRAAAHASTSTGDLVGVLTLLCIVGAVGCGVVAVTLLVRLLQPSAVRAVQGSLRAAPMRFFLVGVLTALGAVLFLGICRQLDLLGALLAFGTLALLLWWAVLGLAAVFTELGERLQAGIGGLGLGSDAAALLAGGVLLGTANFLPGVGQIVVLAGLLAGMGAAAARQLEQIFSRKARKAAPPASPGPDRSPPAPDSPGTP